MPRMTKQKRELYDAISSFSSFFNAVDLQQKVPKIGLATIYRFLNSIENKGEIHSFLCENRKIYSNNRTSHAHFKCEKCLKTKHIHVKNVDFLDSINDDVCHFQIELAGVCEDCK